MDEVEYCKIHEFYLPPKFINSYSLPAVNVEDMQRILRKGTSDGKSIEDVPQLTRVGGFVM